MMMAGTGITACVMLRVVNIMIFLIVGHIRLLLKAGASVDNTELLITPTGTQNVVVGDTVNFSVVKAERTTRLSSPQRIIPIVATIMSLSEPVT